LTFDYFKETFNQFNKKVHLDKNSFSIPRISGLLSPKTSTLAKPIETDSRKSKDDTHAHVSRKVAQNSGT